MTVISRWSLSCLLQHFLLRLLRQNCFREERQHGIPIALTQQPYTQNDTFLPNDIRSGICIIGSGIVVCHGITIRLTVQSFVFHTTCTFLSLR